MRNFKVLAALALSAGLLPSLQMEAGLIPEANAPVLYGFNIASAGAHGFGSFAAKDGRFELMPGSSSIDPNSVAYRDGKLYVLRVVSNWWSGDSYYIDIYDTLNWDQISTHQIEGVSPQSGRGISVSEDGTKLYMLTSARDEDYNLNNYLTAVDLSTYELDNLIEVPVYYYYGVCTGKDVNNFFLMASGLLLNIDLSTNAITELCSPDVNINSSNMAYDSHLDKLYLVQRFDDQLNHVVSIDNVKTGELTDLGPVDGLVKLNGLTSLPSPKNVPDAVSNVCFDYASAGALESTLTFDLPSLTYGGTALTGDLTVILEIDGEKTELTGTPGNNVKVDKTLSNGMHVIKIFVSNEEGLSPERRFHTFAGVDAPGEVENLEFDIDEEGNVTLSWDAPAKSAQGGTFDKNDLTYKVVRFPGNITVAENLKEQTFKESLGDAFGNYYYTITPSASGLEGLTATTMTIKSGSVNVPPFADRFDVWDDFGRWTIENPLDNYYGWNIMSGGALCSISTGETSDYYLFSPQIRLKSDETYTLSFDYRLNGWGEGYNEMDVYICREADSSAEGKIMFEKLRTTDHDGITYFKDFKVDEDGIYYICFHNTTPTDGMACQITRVQVDPNSSIHGPAAVTGLSAKAGEKGVLTATLSFTLPTANVDGTPLSSVTKVEVWNEATSEHITVKENCTPGETITWTDENALQGINNYAVAAYSALEKGMTTHVSQFVGTDTPGAVGTVKVTTAEGINTISWTAPSETGKNGGYVDVTSLKYNVYFKEDPTGYYSPQIGYSIEGLEMTHDSYMLPEDVKQKVVQYVVKPVYNDEEGLENSRLYTMGEAYTLPYMDSFKGETYQTDGWICTEAEGKAAWSIANGNTILVKPSDLDGGMLQFVNNGIEGASASLRTPKLILGQDSRIGLDLYHGNDVEPGDMYLTLSIVDNDDNITEVTTIDFNDGSEGWKHHIVELGSFEGKEAMLILKGFAYDSTATLFIDNISVTRGYAVDAALLNLMAPMSASRGDQATVKVINAGMETASFDVVLYKNDEKVAVSPIENLAAGASAVVEMDMCITPEDAMTTLTYRAVALLDGDMNADNDSSAEVEVFVKRNTIPTVEIEGETSSANEVTISWEPAGNLMAVPTTDDFESYSAYALDNFGGWRTLDVDGKQTTFNKFWTAITNAKAPMAFEVWNNAQVREDGFFDFGVNEDIYRARSGESMLIAFTAIQQSMWGEAASQNDNWLFSPEVLGGTDVTFYAKNSSTPEIIEVYYTAEDVDFTVESLEQFTLIETYTISENDWREISFVLPADAVRFAVRHCTNGGSLLMLDDFTFQPATGSTQEVSVTGYNIYRDGEQIDSVTECEFTDKPGIGQHIYYVTTMTDAGESAASNPFYADIALGVEGISEGISVKGGEGCIVISSASTEDCSIYAASGMQVFCDTVSGVKSIDCAAGVYVVVIADSRHKIVVK